MFGIIVIIVDLFKSYYRWHGLKLSQIEIAITAMCVNVPEISVTVQP